MSLVARIAALLALLAALTARAPQGSGAPDACAETAHFLEESIRGLEELAGRKVVAFRGREREVGSGFDVELRALTERDVRAWFAPGLEHLRAELVALHRECAREGADARALAAAAWRAQSRGITFLWNTHIEATRAAVAVLQSEVSRTYGARQDRWRALERAEGEDAEARRATFRQEEAELRERILLGFEGEYLRLARLRPELVARLWRLEQAADEAGDEAWRESLSVQRFEAFDLATGYAPVPTLRLDVVHGLLAEERERFAAIVAERGDRNLDMRRLYEPDVQQLVAGPREAPLPEVVALRVVELHAVRYREIAGPVQHERPFYVEVEFLLPPEKNRYEVELASSIDARPILVQRVEPRLFRSAVLFLAAAPGEEGR